jgi:hypothetical protein
MRLTLLCIIGSAAGLLLPTAPPARRGTPAMQMQSWNPFENLKQMADQRIAKLSHCLIAAGSDMTIEEANAKIEAWKTEVGNDEAKFIELVKRESEDPVSAADGGSVGIFSRGKLGTNMDALVFQEDVKPVENGGTGGVTRGPIATKFNGKAGLSLMYVHTCWEPMSTGVVGALFDPPNSLKKKINDAMVGGDKE